MTPELWAEVQRLFQSTLNLAPEFRSRYLEQACGGDTDLRREVESLLACEGSAEGFLREAVEEAAALASISEFTGGERFEVKRKLGSGGFGVVYQVYDRLRDAVLALKTLPRAAPSPLSQFKREFRALADLSHPNLVELYELMVEDGQWFFTMEYVDGVDFLQYVRRNGGEFARLRSVLRELAAGIDALHRYGKQHCDLKPQNVLVSASGRVTILDFGLVSDASTANERSGVVFGTPEYMAPEQAAGRVVSAASDWYSFGVMLYEALTAELPFSGSFGSLLRNKQTIDPVPASRLRPDAPPDLCGLAQGLLRREPSLRPTGEQVLHDLGAAEAVPIRVASKDRALLLGRESELAVLRSALDAAAQGNRTTVFVHGPSGIGKSALISHFLGEVRKQKSHLVLEGRCHERESVPYKAFDSLIDNLNGRLLDLSHAERGTMLPGDFGALARLFPVLEALGEGLGLVQIPKLAELRLRGFAVLRDLLARVAMRQPMVLFIDDLQWGDTDSAAPLLDLMCETDPARILFLVCYRSDEVDTSPLLRRLFGDRGSRAFTNGVDLLVEPLADGAGRSLACALLRQRGQESTSLGEEIAREAGGNPFFIGELVEHWATEGGRGMPGADLRPDSAAVSLDDLVRRRIASQPKEARRLMEVIALAGQPIGLAIATMAARVDTGAYIALAGLRAHHLIRMRRTEASEEIEAYHSRIRQSAESSMSAEALRECHYRLATAGESVEPSDPRFLALHFRRAGVADKAFGYSMRAGNDAAAALAFESAAQFYRYALEFAPQDVAREALQVQLGESLCNAGRGVEGAQVYLMAAKTCPAAESLELRRRAAAHLLMAGRVEEGLALMKQFLKGFGMPVARSKGAALFSFLLGRLWIRLRGLKFRLRAVSEIPARELLRIDIFASSMQGLAMVDPTLASPFHARALALALRAGEPRRVSVALCGEAGYLAMRGCNISRVQHLLERAQALADLSGSQSALGMVELSRGITAFLRGAWKQSDEFMMLAEVTLRERCIGAAWEVATAHMMGNVALFQMGEIKRLKQRLPRNIRDAEARGDRFEVTDLRTRLAHVLCRAADSPERAHEEIRAAIALWQRQTFDLQHWWGWIGSVETDLYAGEPRSAWMRIQGEWSNLRWSFLTRVQYVHVESLQHRARAAIALAAADTTLRRALLRCAERDAGRMTREKTPWSIALAALLRAGIAATRGSRGESVMLLESAEGLLIASDMVLYGMAARHRRGKLVGGEYGCELWRSAEEWMRSQEILNPERMCAALAPGF